MSNDRLGVIGGMGPQATNTFYQYIIDRTDARTDQEHLSVLIFSDCAMPDRTAAILGTQEQKDEVYARLLSDARMLEGAGCTAIAVPCNTSHYFLDQVQEQISIPIVHMIRETARLLVSQEKSAPAFWPPTAPSKPACTSGNLPPWASTPPPPGLMPRSR